MTTAIINSTQGPVRRRRSRRGMMTGMLLVVLLFLSGCLALGLNAGRLLNSGSQMRATCRAAALAGAAELMDEGILVGKLDPRDDVMMAREAARIFAQMNPVDNRPIKLDVNRSNDPNGDIVLCTVDPLGSVNQLRHMPTAETSPVNTVRVTLGTKRNAYDRLSLWFGNVTGVANTGINITAQATLDRRVAGFRPEPGVRVPVVPLAADYQAWMRGALTAAVAGQNDQFAVNYQTGAVMKGADGVPEIIFICSAAANEAAAGAAEVAESADPSIAEPTGFCAALKLNDDGTDPWIWSTRCREGLGLGDLRPWGGEIVVRGGSLPMPVFATLPAPLPWDLADLVGKCRAWPLGMAGTSNGAPGYNVVGFAAGRIVAVRQSTASSTAGMWEIVVQPSTLVSSQAVATATMSQNPWIGKLELTE